MGERVQTIINLWNGNVAPVEHCGAHDSEANRLVRLMARNREMLCEGLTIAQAELFQRYIECSEDYLLRMMELAFCDGFRIGGRLVMEMNCDT